MVRSKYDAQLGKMNDTLVEMGGLCEKAIYNATEALKNGDVEHAKLIILEDEEIDALEKEVERICLKLLLQQQPVAKDLRQVSAALKMITDMERIGDQTADIAEIVITSNIDQAKDISKIQKMSEKAAAMVKNSVKAFVDKDLELAKKVMMADDEVDALFDEIKNELVQYVLDNQDHKEVVIDLIIVTKYLERIADHATNIAEWVEFSITGVQPMKPNKVVK